MSGPFKKSYWVRLPGGPTIQVDREYAGDTDSRLTSGVEESLVLSTMPAGSQIVSQRYAGSIKRNLDTHKRKENSSPDDFDFIEFVLFLCYIPSHLFERIPIVGKPLSIVSWITTSCMIWGGLFYNISNIRIPLVHEISSAGWYIASQSSTPVYKFLLDETKKTDSQFDDIVLVSVGGPFYFMSGFMEGLREGIHGK